jgi:hypothetical protein
MSLSIEETILKNKERFYDNNEASGDALFENVAMESFNIKPADAPLALPPFKLPYYEGFKPIPG